MPTQFKVHSLTKTAKSRTRAASMADAATEYFAYITLVTAGVAVAVMTMAFSANVAFSWLDKIAKPGYFDGDVRPTSAPVNSTPSVKPVMRGQFAMLPASMPVRMKDDVISSNY